MGVCPQSGRRWFIRGLEIGVCPPKVVGGGKRVIQSGG